MAILLVCCNSECGEIFSVPDDVAGSQTACPTCGMTQPVPPGGEQASAGSDQPIAADRQRPEASGVKRVELPLVDDSSRQPAKAAAAPGQTPRKSGVDLRPRDGGPSPPGASGPHRGAVPAPVSKPTQADVAQQRAADVKPDVEPFVQDSTLELTSAPEPGGGDVLENRGVAVMPFIVGLFGMVWGVLIGAMWFADDRAIAAYVGAGFGWVVGFVLGFMLAAAGDKDRPARARCPLCHNVFAAETGTCSFCGSPLQTQIFSPLTADCLKAASYPLEDVVTIYWMALSLTGGVRPG